MNIIYAIVAGAFLMLVSFIGGCQHERDAMEAAAQSVRAQDVQIAKAMQPQLTRTLTVSHTVTVTLTKQVTHYVDRYIAAPGAASVARPAYYLTNGSVFLWRCALSPDATGCAAQAPAGPNPLELSPTTFDDAETNAIENFGQYRDCRTIVKGWQDWFESVKKVKP